MTAEDGKQGLSSSTIFRLTYGGLCRRPVATFFMALICIYLLSVSATFLLPAPDANVFSIAFGLWSLKVAVLLSPGVIFRGWIAFVIADDSDAPQQRRPLMEVIQRLLPLLAIETLVIVVTILGLLLLLIPGVIWSLLMTAATPALLVERLKVLDAVNRSIDLTEDRLWSILGCLIVTLAPLIAVSALLKLVSDSPMITNGILPVVDALTSMAGAAFAAAIYRETRRLGPVKRSGEAP
ncbi:MAG: hypothetical protein AB7O98_17050 [Hyphomonadaceae bacterium]